MDAKPIWIVMPVVAGPEMTEAAIADCLAQSVPTKLLVINQGVDTAFRERLERIAESEEDRIVVWHHEPPLLSLAASWNRALNFVWQSGGTEALVINNDVRLHPRTVEILSRVRRRAEALFVTAVGVTAEQFDPTLDLVYETLGSTHKGGPDFSCFLISNAGHWKYPFDESFIPAFCEDLDTHRRYMLGGDGDRIFSVNLPYLHLSSQTLKQVKPRTREMLERQIDQGSRAYYAKKWGGPVNAERFYTPFNKESYTLDDSRIDMPADTPGMQEWVKHKAVSKGAHHAN